MHPALTNIQNSVRAAELHDRAERDRRQRMPRRHRTPSPEQAETGSRPARAPLFGQIFGTHGYFGREHGSHV
ncbi:MAG TPA: hypothetical protein VGM91_17790 [Conexibacter sp.]|jgi:hypothetical protein